MFTKHRGRQTRLLQLQTLGFREKKKRKEKTNNRKNIIFIVSKSMYPGQRRGLSVYRMTEVLRLVIVYSQERK